MLARIAVVLLFVSSIASADDDPRVWLFDITVTTEIGLYDGSAGDPISVAPDISLLTKGAPQIEIIHSSAAITGFHGIPLGTSLCVSGDGCGDIYHNAGVQLTYALRNHAVEGSPQDINRTAFSIVGGLLAANFDPFEVSLKLGLRASYLTSDMIQFQVVPNVHIAVTDRDARDDRLFVPVTMTVLASEQLTLQLETGVAASFDDVGDSLQIPVGANIDITSNGNIDLLASFSFPAAYGGDAVGVTGLDARVLTVGLRWSKFLGGTTD